MSQNYSTIKQYDSYNTKFTFNESEEFEFDVFDADNAELYEDAINMLQAEELKVKKTGKLSERIKSEYNLYAQFFDFLLGKGAFEKIMKGKKNTLLYNNCFIAFIEFIAKQRDAMIVNKNKTALSQKKAKQNKATVKVAKAKK